jgi:hypothetical protein
MIQQGLGEDAPRGIAGAEKQDVVGMIGHGSLQQSTQSNLSRNSLAAAT